MVESCLGKHGANLILCQSILCAYEYDKSHGLDFMQQSPCCHAHHRHAVFAAQTDEKKEENKKIEEQPAEHKGEELEVWHSCCSGKMTIQYCYILSCTSLGAANGLKAPRYKQTIIQGLAMYCATIPSLPTRTGLVARFQSSC